MFVQCVIVRTDGCNGFFLINSGRTSWGFVHCHKNEIAFRSSLLILPWIVCTGRDLPWFKDKQGSESSLSTWLLWLTFLSRRNLQGIFLSGLVKHSLNKCCQLCPRVDVLVISFQIIPDQDVLWVHVVGNNIYPKPCVIAWRRGILGRIKTQSLRTGCLSSLHGYLSRLLAVLFCDCSCNWAGILAGWEILKHGFETDCDFFFFFLECFKLKGFRSSHNGEALFKSVKKVKSSRTSWRVVVKPALLG